MKKKIFIFLLILLLPHCGFSPLYNQSNKHDYAINITEINGDKLINNKILSEIKQISNSQSKNKFNVKVNTSYEKIIISKKINGTVSDYQLNVKTKFDINHNNEIQTYSFGENLIIKNNSDFFEQKNYENTIKKTFATSLVRKLNLKLLSIK